MVVVPSGYLSTIWYNKSPYFTMAMLNNQMVLPLFLMVNHHISLC